MNEPARPFVRVDPAVGYGYGIIGARTPTDVVAGMVMAGETVETAADEYGLTRHEVLLACWYEAVHGEYRAEWDAWSQMIGPKLGGWIGPFDPETEPGPPSREEMNR